MGSSSLTASLFLLSVVFWQFVAAAVAPVAVKAKVGEDATLPCKPAGTKVVIQAEWSTPNQSSAPVLLYKDKKVDANQLDAYKGRVSLVNPEKGDLSLVLKKVVDKDAGKYECRVELGADEVGGEAATPPPAKPGRRSILNSDPISIVELTVEGMATQPSQISNGGVGLRPNVVLPVGLLVLLVLIAGLQ